MLLRIAALASLGWAIAFLSCKPLVLGSSAHEPVAASLANGLAVAHVGLAFVFWRGAADPGRERAVLYLALVVLGLRAAFGVYHVLYVLRGVPAMASLVDMVTSLALFIGVLNALPNVLHGGPGRVAE